MSEEHREPISCAVCGVAEPKMFGCDEAGEFYCREHFPRHCDEDHGEECLTVVWQEETD